MTFGKKKKVNGEIHQTHNPKAVKIYDFNHCIYTKIYYITYMIYYIKDNAVDIAAVSHTYNTHVFYGFDLLH